MTQNIFYREPRLALTSAGEFLVRLATYSGYIVTSLAGAILLISTESAVRSVGALIALYERAVGFYGSLVHINAYHQPGVEAGKKAAGVVLSLQQGIAAELRRAPGSFRTAREIAAAVGGGASVETVFRVLEHLAANPGRGIARRDGPTPFDALYGAS